MAFQTIPQEWIEVGQAVKKRLFQRVKDSLDDHEQRLNNVEGGTLKVDVFNFAVYGYINNYRDTELMGISNYVAPNDFLLTEFTVTLVENVGIGATGWYSASSAHGTLEVNLEKSLDSGISWIPVCISRATIPATPSSALIDNVANGIIGVATIDPAQQQVLTGNMLRLSVTSRKVRQGSFHIHCYGELS